VGVSIDSVCADTVTVARMASSRGLHDHVGRNHRARFADQPDPQTLDDRAQRHDRPNADSDAQEEKQQPPPGRAELARRHAK